MIGAAICSASFAKAEETNSNAETMRAVEKRTIFLAEQGVACAVLVLVLLFLCASAFGDGCLI